MGMVQLTQVFGFARKLLFVVIIDPSSASTSNSIFFSSIDVFHEELLDGNLYGCFEFTQCSGNFDLGHSQVGDAERALTQYLFYGIGM